MRNAEITCILIINKKNHSQCSLRLKACTNENISAVKCETAVVDELESAVNCEGASLPASLSTAKIFRERRMAFVSFQLKKAFRTVLFGANGSGVVFNVCGQKAEN